MVLSEDLQNLHTVLKAMNMDWISLFIWLDVVHVTFALHKYFLTYWCYFFKQNLQFSWYWMVVQNPCNQTVKVNVFKSFFFCSSWGHSTVGSEVFQPFQSHVNYPKNALGRRRRGCNSLFFAMNWHERLHFKGSSDFIFFSHWISMVPYQRRFA